jgi:predicted DsbA family dithiol-disulfide isomerase
MRIIRTRVQQRTTECLLSESFSTDNRHRSDRTDRSWFVRDRRPSVIARITAYSPAVYRPGTLGAIERRVSKIRVVHFSDVLCVWAHIAEPRVRELLEEFGSRIEIEYRFVSVFGSGESGLRDRWRDRGGLDAYAAHVREAAAPHDHVVVHPHVWARVAPASSWPAHLLLCAVRILEREGHAEPGSLPALASSLRRAFFHDAQDVSREDVLHGQIAAHRLDGARVFDHLSTGRAHAELAADLHLSRDQDVRVSPSILLNEGRQRMNGNVGYRVLAANVREMLEKPVGGASWC